MGIKPDVTSISILHCTFVLDCDYFSLLNWLIHVYLSDLHEIRPQSVPSPANQFPCNEYGGHNSSGFSRMNKNPRSGRIQSRSMCPISPPSFQPHSDLDGPHTTRARVQACTEMPTILPLRPRVRTEHLSYKEQRLRSFQVLKLG